MARTPENYLNAFLTHSANVTAVACGVLASVVASIPYGWRGMVLVGLATVTAEVLAALSVPLMPSFREHVDATQVKDAREARRARLLQELSQFSQRTLAPYAEPYKRMTQRVASLRDTARSPRFAIQSLDVDRLDDATVDYLGLVLNMLAQENRSGAVNLADIRTKVDQLQRSIKNAGPGVDVRSMQKAVDDYTTLLTRHSRMGGKKTAIEAALALMPDQMEEVYHLAITEGSTNEAASRLESSISRLRLSEDLEAELNLDIDAELRRVTNPTATTTPVRRPTTQRISS